MKELEWNSDSQRVEIRFSYDKKLVDLVRELPGRRWHPEEKVWSVPRESLSEVAHRLIPLGFSPSPTVKELLEDPAMKLPAEGRAPTPSAAPADSPPTVTATRVSDALPRTKVTGVGEPVGGETWSISSLNERVRAILRERLPGSFWVVGEVVGFDRNAHKSHVFFSLAEKEEGDDAARATVTAVLFAGARGLVERTLAVEGGGLAFQDGVRVRLEVSVDLYPKTGSFQLLVTGIDPTFTLGEIALRRERILRQVREAGLAERNLSLPFPVPPLKVGVITSLGSDAYNDFLSELSRSRYSFEIFVADAHVQGERLERDVLRALDHFAVQRVDVVVITRGGGSRTDLMGFDTPDLAFAVARHPVKILIGIGHQQDRSVLDEIAHSEKTPTAAAAHLVALCREAEEDLRRSAERLGHSLDAVIHRERGRAALWQEGVGRAVRAQLSGERGRLARAGVEVALRGRRVLRTESNRLVEWPRWLSRRGRRSIRRAYEQGHERGLRLSAQLAARLVATRERLTRVSDRLPRGAARALERARDRFLLAERELPRRARRRIRDAEVRVETLRERITSRDPAEILARGYAWLRTPEGATIASVAGVRAGDPIVARLRDGSIAARVESSEREDGAPPPTRSPATD